MPAARCYERPCPPSASPFSAFRGAAETVAPTAKSSHAPRSKQGEACSDLPCTPEACDGSYAGNLCQPRLLEARRATLSVGRQAGVDAFRAFDRLGKAYLHFAKSEPAYYSAMFEAGIPLEASPELQKAGERAFAMLRTATERLIATLPAQQRPPALMMTLHIWALAHG